ncbi:MAG: hypothetical protein HON23_04140 [Rickettsiales bacterium]|jgi:hypothetical protein|nr:hypothetical protein [Rickettsiales bacterium]
MGIAINKAYTLLEQAIALTLLSFVVIMTILITDYQYDRSFYDDSGDKILVIEKALLAHMMRYSKDVAVVSGNPLLCPAPIDSLVTSSSFGKSDSVYTDSGGDCLGSYATDSISLDNYYYGMVPVRSLGLADDYAFDSWGRRFLFLVNKDIFQTYDTDILVDDYTETLYYIISYGKNGYGGYGKGGSLLDSSNASAYEANNIISTIDIANIQDMPRQSDYDDIVVSKTLLQYIADLAGGTIYTSGECSSLQPPSGGCADAGDVDKISDYSCVFR